MFNNKIGSAPTPILPSNPNPNANPAGPVARPAAPNQVANGQMPAGSHAPTVQLERRRMGGQTYSREAIKVTGLGLRLRMPDELLPLLGDGTKVSLHCVPDHALSTKGTGPYHFIGRDPSDRGRALVHVEAALGKRTVYEVTFNFKELPLLAKAAHTAPKL